MNQPGQQNLELALNLIKTMEGEIAGEILQHYYDEDIIQIEYPNAFTPKLVTRCFNDLNEGNAKDQLSLKDQEFDVRKTYSFNNTVIVEAVWSGTLAAPWGSMPSGRHLKAYLSRFFEFREGKIIRQRNYDCFESL